MTKYFTPSEQLIKYIYQELTEQESEAFEQHMRSNDHLMQEYLDHLNILGSLNELSLEPSETVIHAIKTKARSSGLQKA
ncbi:hypothetical protein GCM10007049_11910 [Echinicola pacifica]|uniref:Uncharacterized protein n=1 Tax=Echinicola pacifica TaxID=346377 RepID=A0A918PSY8_9BACT|nr:hypothetical protein [Echinicola pacifica]GGZ20923.1 hypothetical protein GCM10007049_11910 [Echinicola pacifica]